VYEYQYELLYQYESLLPAANQYKNEALGTKLGSVSGKPRKVFGPEKPSVKI